jgi:hypothetical protein
MPHECASGPATAPGAHPTVGDVTSFLEQLVRELEPAFEPPAGGRGRPRVLPSLAVWGALLLTVLDGGGSQRAVWRRISDLGLWHFRPLPVTDQAVYNRLERDGTAPLERLFTTVTTLLAQRVAPWSRQELAPFASAVYVLDETTLDPVTRAMTGPDGRRARRRLPGKLAGRYNLRSQLWETLLLIGTATQNEKVAARDLLAGIPHGSLLLCDLGYFAFRWFDELTLRGCFYISRWKERTSYEVRHVYYERDGAFDGIVWLGKYRADRAEHAVRLIVIPRGNGVHRYLTNVLDPALLSPQEVVALYARRWDIELAFKLVKTHLGISLWWRGKDVVIHQQLWATLIIAQILAALRLEIAGEAGVEPFDVSLALLVEQLPQYVARGWDPVATFVERGRRMGYIRPSRRLQVVVSGFELAAYAWPPPDLELTRTPRYAERDSLPRSA